VAAIKRIQLMRGVAGFVIAAAPPTILIKKTIRNGAIFVRMIFPSIGTRVMCKLRLGMEIKKTSMAYAAGFVFR
jgi:hypothetical protein